MSRKLAIVIGNSEYDDATLAGLAAPGADVNTLAAVLRDPQIGGFDEVEALINQPAASVRRAISAFYVGRNKDDLLLLYFSGHGIRDDRGQLFLAVKDTEHSLLRGTGIPSGFITEEMDNSRSRRQVLILDCCHSGAFTSGMKGGAGESVGTAAAFEGTGAGRVVLTATDSTQYAWEGDRVIGKAENSVFTHYLIQGLHTGQADADGDGRITLDELYNYVYEHVVDETPLQTPGKWSYGQQGEIVIAFNPSPVVRPVALPPDLQQTIDDPRPWVREGAAQELERILQGGSAGTALSAREALQRLAQDDSRRVAGEAARILAAHPSPAPEGAPVVETESMGRAAASPGSQAAARRDASLVTTRETKAGDAMPIAAAAQAMPDRRMLPLVLITALGWAASFALGFILSNVYGSLLVGGIMGAVAGLLMGLALNKSGFPVTWQQILLLMLGWGVAFLLIWGTDAPLVMLFDHLGWDTRSPFMGAIGGVVGGLATGLALRWRISTLRWQPVLIILLGWIAAGFVDVLLFVGIDNAPSGIPIIAFAAFLGGVIGLIGSLVMASQLRHSGA
ncbi:MAG TPA: caspase family protein [Anaerolineaceae bacterium]